MLLGEPSFGRRRGALLPGSVSPGRFATGRFATGRFATGRFATGLWRILRAMPSAQAVARVMGSPAVIVPGVRMRA